MTKINDIHKSFSIADIAAIPTQETPEDGVVERSSAFQGPKVRYSLHSQNIHGKGNMISGLLLPVEKQG